MRVAILFDYGINKVLLSFNPLNFDLRLETYSDVTECATFSGL